MLRAFRSGALVCTATIVAVFGSSPAFCDPVAQNILVPGGRAAWVKVAGLPTVPDRARFLAEMARLIHGGGSSARQDEARIELIALHAKAVMELQAALAPFPGGMLTLDGLTPRSDAARNLDRLCDAAGFRLRERDGRYSVEPADDRDSKTRAQRLDDLGIDRSRIASLNGGGKVVFEIPGELVPIPPGGSFWRVVIFEREVPDSQLFSAIIADSRAALLAHGLAGVDDETAAFVAAHPKLARRIHQQDAALFAAFGTSIQVHADRVIVPGGDEAVPLWEAIAGARANEPERFIEALLSKQDGRLIYLYDALGDLDDARRRFALGLWTSDPRARVERFRAFAAAAAASLEDWRGRAVPFARPVSDVVWLLLNVQPEPDGTPGLPNSRRFWTFVFDPSADIEFVSRDETSAVTVDAAWLAEHVLPGPSRTDALFQFALGTRIFRTSLTASQLTDAVGVLRVAPRFPALMLTLERMGVTTPSIYGTAAGRAVALSGLSKEKAPIALAQCQGALALIAKFVDAGSVDARQADVLVASLFQVPLKDDSFGSAIAQWIRVTLLPSLDRRDNADAAVRAALAGFRREEESLTAVRIEWEGERYRLNLRLPEERRLERLAPKMGAYTLDAAIGLERVEESLRRREVTLDEVRSAGESLTKLSATLEAGSEKERLLRVIKDLAKITRPRDTRNAARSAEPLSDLAGIVAGRALTAFVYAANVADTSEGNAAVDLHRRHDFGLKDKRDSDASWSIPREMVIAGAPRHVRGSLLALDVAFAGQTLRRVDQSARTAPVLVWNDRETLIQSVAFLNPYRFTDADRDALSAAISRGRQRVATLAGNSESVSSISREILLDGWRRQAVAWAAVHEPQQLESYFSLAELMVLGGESPANFDRWGAANSPVSGCLCTRLTPADRWRLLSGRPQIGSLATAVADVTLHVVTTLSDLRLPAALTKLVAGAAMQDFFDQVKPNDPDDWLTLVRAAQATTSTRIADFVAIATARGPLVPDEGDSGAPR